MAVAGLFSRHAAPVVLRVHEKLQQVDGGATWLTAGWPSSMGIGTDLLEPRQPSSRPNLHRCHTVLDAVWRRRRVLAWLSAVVEEWCSLACYTASMVQTSCYEQHKLQLLATQLGVCTSGHS